MKVGAQNAKSGGEKHLEEISASAELRNLVEQWIKIRLEPSRKSQGWKNVDGMKMMMFRQMKLNKAIISYARKNGLSVGETWKLVKETALKVALEGLEKLREKK